jgi:hypothetical protein
VLATGTLQPVCIGLFASVSGHIWAPSESVNAFLQFYFNDAQTRGNPRVSCTIRCFDGANRCPVR